MVWGWTMEDLEGQIKRFDLGAPNLGAPWQMLYLISAEKPKEVSDRAHIPTRAGQYWDSVFSGSPGPPSPYCDLRRYFAHLCPCLVPVDT